MKDNQKQQDKFHALAIPKWKRSPLPEGLFESPIGKANLQIEGSHPAVRVGSDLADNLLKASRQDKSLGEKFNTYIEGFGKDTLHIVSKATGFESPKIKLSYQLEEDGHNYLLNQLIVAEPGSKLEVQIDLNSSAGGPVRCFGKTTVVAMAGSVVKVVRLQRLASDAQVFDMTQTFAMEGASLEVIDLQLGSGYKAVSHESELLGAHSRSELKTAYYGEGREVLDLSASMTHSGRQSESVILAKGALADQAKKVFRGNLFFNTGASESLGREQEYVTLLSPSVSSDSFPALMCSEDDVVGEHAASVGQVDTEKLFYLMCRGFSETEAKRLLIKAAFDEIISGIGDSELETLAAAEMDRRLA